jgi:hypothetical protein
MYVFGSGVLQGQRTDISNSAPVNFGLVQDVTLDWSFDLKEGYGQYQWPVVLARGKGKATGKAKVLRASGYAIGNLFFGLAPTAGQTATSFAESHPIPSTPYQITVTQSATYVADYGVVYNATGLPLTEVASSPATGQYSVNTSTGVYTFAAADTGLTVLISYTYTIASTGLTISITNQLMGTTPTFSGNFYTTFQGKAVTINLPNCVSSKLNFAGKLDDYTMPEFDFGVFASAANVIGTWSFGEAS